MVEEVKRGPFVSGEQDAFEDFFIQAEIAPCPKFNAVKGSLSLQDQASLIYAERNAPAVLLVDDRLLRRAAKKAAVPVIGFPGILIQARLKDLVSEIDAMRLLDEAIEFHDYRISISLYQALRKQIVT